MLTIGALSRATQIPADTLRSWERRYGSPVPVRKPSGHRLYPAVTVEQLRLVLRLLAHGHRASDVLGLSSDALASMLALSEPVKAPARSGRSTGTATEASSVRSVAILMAAASALDREAISEELRMSWVHLGPARFLQEVSAPFMVEVGRAWAGRSLGIRHEHLASACVLDFLRSAREPFDREARGPRVVVAMLPGDEHEGGLLMLALLLAVHGHRVVYLGLETPVEEIAAAALDRDVEAVAVSVSPTLSGARAASAVARLRKTLPARMRLWLGGAGAPAAPRRVERFASLEELAARLAPRD
jgi:methylmalonyl-CoA mutase cobalamin-binding subunit